MSANATDFDYVSARIHARHGARADARTWARLAPFRDYPSYLNAIRGTALEPFSDGLGPADGIHDVERRLRQTWSAYVEGIAGWHGRGFAPAFRLLGDLPRLPEAAYLSAGNPPQAWFAAAELDTDIPTDFDAWRAGVLAALPGERFAAAGEASLEALLPADGSVPDAHALRTASERLFRKTMDPFVGVLAHLGAIAGDLMALRGELAVRLVFGSVPTEGT